MGDESFKETLTNFIFKSLENDRPPWCEFLEKSNDFDLTPDDQQHSKDDLNLPFDEFERQEFEADIRLIFKLPTLSDDEQEQNVHKIGSTSGNSLPMPSTSNSYAVGSSISQNCIGNSSPPGIQNHHQHIVKQATKLIKSDDYYKMTSNPRGYCIIINNVDFYGDIGHRKGSDEEVKFLRSIFEQLFFEVKELRNQTGDEMVSGLETVAQDAQLSHHEGLILIILSHGTELGVLGVDGSVCPLDFLIEPFNNENCPNLIDKPKMIFVQACRGGSHDFGVAVGVGVKDVPDKSRSRCVPDIVTTRRIPTLTDIYVCWSSPIGHVAMRSEETGSWFGNCLGEVIRDHACEFHLEKIIKEVTKRVNSQMSVMGTMQSVSPTLIGWTKELYFNPGLYE